MLDQAHDLRRLATERVRPKAARAASRPTLLAVMGGKGGVGTTTIALKLAAALAQAGRRTLLVDADPRGGDAALRCGVEEQYTLSDLLAGRRTWTEVIQAAPGGIQLVAGDRWSEDIDNGSSAVAERFVELLGGDGVRADAAVIDVGNGAGRTVQRICRMADAIVMVTTCEAAAVVGTFAAIKTFARFARDQRGTDAVDSVFSLHLLVNMARMVRDAETVHFRLGRACRRLLGVDIAKSEKSLTPSAFLVDTVRELRAREVLLN